MKELVVIEWLWKEKKLINYSSSWSCHPTFATKKFRDQKYGSFATKNGAMANTK